MPKKSKLLDDNVYKNAINELKKIGNVGDISNKLQAIISAKKHGIKKVCEIFDINKNSLYAWIKKIKNNAIVGLSKKQKQAQKSKLNSQNYKAIFEWLKK